MLILKAYGIPRASVTYFDSKHVAKIFPANDQRLPRQVRREIRKFINYKLAPNKTLTKLRLDIKTRHKKKKVLDLQTCLAIKSNLYVNLSQTCFLLRQATSKDDSWYSPSSAGNSVT